MSDRGADTIRDALALTFTDGEAAARWLDRPSPYLHGRTPRQEIADDRYDRVLAALEALNSGFAS